jgi:raffinose/stachyose/melibiose transport system permease protein
MGPIFASIILAVVPMVIIYLLFQEQIQKGMTAGSVKG